MEKQTIKELISVLKKNGYSFGDGIRVLTLAADQLRISMESKLILPQKICSHSLISEGESSTSPSRKSHSSQPVT